MPETPFTVELPNGDSKHCYSPSSIVHQYFKQNDQLPTHEFLEKARAALHEASARVEAKYGYACTGALASLDAIENWASTLDPEDTLTITRI